MTINQILKQYDERLKGSGLTKPTQNVRRDMLKGLVISLYNKDINTDEDKLRMLEDFTNQSIT